MTIAQTRPLAPSLPRRRRDRRSPRAGASSLAPLILSVSAALALARLMTQGVSARFLVPVVVAIALADAVTAVAVRLQINVVLAVAVGWAISLCALLVLVDPSVFVPGSSHFFYASVTSDQLRAARAALVNDGTPLPALNGIVLVLGAIAAGAGALTRGIWVCVCRRPLVDQARGPLSPCLAPSAAIFLYTTLVSAERGRVPAFVSYLLGVLIFLAIADRTTTTVPVANPPPLPAKVAGGHRHHSGKGWGGVAAGAAVVLIVIGAGAGLSGMRLTVFHVTPSTTAAASRSTRGQGVPSNLITGISLVDHLRATEITQSHTVIFHATSPVATYWQVGTLSSFNGTEWAPSPQVRTALSGSSGALQAALSSTALPTPAPSQTFTARVTITDFSSRLLPAPPGTLAVHGLSGATAVQEEGVLTSSAQVTGASYSLTAPLDAGLPTAGRQLPSSDPRLAPYLALPTEPAVVSQLARQAVGGASTPAAKAQALVDWFRSGQFRYTLSPPPTTGANPLVQFLTVTRAGYCEQFAGAFGVLARSLGIPTRLVVGFTAGQAGPNGTFTVTGADAHVWPQVYLGPDAGWVSVEPTPPATAGAPNAEGVVGASVAAGSPANGTVPSTTAATGTPNVTTPATTGTAAGSRGTARRRAPHRAHTPRKGFPWRALLVAAAVALVLLLAGLVIWARRRRRSERAASLNPDEQVVQAWEHALAALRRQGAVRRPAETPAEFASRLRATDDDGTSETETGADTVRDEAVESLARLAGLVELACYTPRQCTAAQVAHARALTSTIVAVHRSYRRGASLSARTPT